MAWRKTALFLGIDENSSNEIKQIIRKKTFRKDEAIFFYEDQGASVYIIESGKIKLSRETKDGMESVMFIASGGDILGENLLFGENNYSYSAYPISESVAYVISLPELRMIIKSSMALSHNAAQILLKRNIRLQKELEHVKVQSAPQRIGCFILGSCNKSNGSAKFELPFEKGLIAAKLGMKPETFSRALNELKAQGVKVDGKKVEVKSIEHLSAFTCSACSENFPCPDIKS